jgi:hypothetical protein
MAGSGEFVAGAVIAGSGHAAATGTGELVAGGNADGVGVAAPTGTGTLVGGAIFSGAGFVAATGTSAMVAGGIISATGNDHPRGTGSIVAGALVDAVANGGAMAAGALVDGAGTAGYASDAQGVWLRIHTIPMAQIYQVDDLRGRMHSGLPMMRIPFDVSATAAALGAQNDSFSIRLERPSSRLRSILSAQAPYGVRVDVMDGGTLSRTGIVDAISADAGGDFTLDCQASGWSDDLPLRTNADLGIFRDVLPLPWRYGRYVPGKCVRLGAAGKRWLWADHASSRITSVTVDSAPYDGWAWRNDIDSDGNPITVIETVDDLDEAAELIATGDGALDVRTGALMTNPADIVGDICRRGGVTIDRGDLAAFRSECHARYLEIAGSIDSGSLQSALVGISGSIYAAFSRSLPGLMRLRPRSAPAITIRATDTPSGSASRSTIATRLRVRYAIEDGKARSSMTIRAPAVEALRGIALDEVTLPWVRDARTAADVAGRILADRARPKYTVPVDRQSRRFIPGEVVAASVPALGLSGSALVMSSSIAERGSTPVLELASGAAPTTEIIASSEAYTPAQYAGATVATQGGDRVIVITDDNGSPLAGASCLLDGATTRFSDGAGKVAFPVSLMPPGPHTIYITASGFDPFTLPVVVP